MISGRIALINGFKPIKIPRFGRIDDAMKNDIPMKSPITILLLALVALILPKMKGIAKNNIITVEIGLRSLSQ